MSYKKIDEMLISEAYKNLFIDDVEPRKRYLNDVWQMLQDTYRPLGGIKGNGFSKPEDLLNIPFWKVITKDGVPVGAVFYKDKGGRKSVAMCTDGSKYAIERVMKDTAHWSKESWSERSGSALGATIKSIKLNSFSISSYLLDVTTVKELLPKDDIYTYDEVVNQNHDLSITSDEMDSVDYLINKYPETKPYIYFRELGGSLKHKVGVGVPGKTIKK